MARIVPEGIVGLEAAKTLWSAMVTYVSTHGGKIDKIKVNNVEQPIGQDKSVNIVIPGGIVVASSAPTGDASKLWIDTGNGGVAKYWNGTAWTTVKSVWG